MQRETFSSAITIGAIGLVLLLVVISFMSAGNKNSNTHALEPIRIATGEWAPYSGEDLPQYGIAAAVVTEILKNAGYAPNYEFMPWPLAEDFSQNNETNNDIRATFPYLGTASRRDRFYYSEPILSAIDHSVYFIEDNLSLNPSPIMADENISFEDKLSSLTGLLKEQTIEQITDELEESSTKEQRAALLKIVQLTVWLETLKARIIPIKGYEVPDILRPYLADVEPVSNTQAAFKLLETSGEKLVVFDASSVGDNILSDKFPVNKNSQSDQTEAASMQPRANNIVSAPIRIPQYVYFIVGKRNPHNRDLIDKFNSALEQLRATGTLSKIENRISTAVSNKKYIRLEPFGQGAFVVAETLDDPKQYLILINGTKARIVEWHAALLNGHSKAPIQTESFKVKVTIEQGPHSGATVLIDSRSIVIP